MESALYVGKLRHRRFSPKEHTFEYPVFLSLLDVDRIPEVMQRSQLSSYERFNVMSYFERDHFGDPRKPLRERIAEDAQKNDVTLPNGKIFVLTHLRYFGYVFNPVSFCYFYDEKEELRLIMAEVNNTFGESHNYWLTTRNEKPAGAGRRYASEKRMHVSPFMPMDLQYDWILTEPGERLVAHMNTIKADKPLFDATLQLDRREWTRAEVRRVLAAYPLMTARVIGAIHWEALKLWIKDVHVFAHPSKHASAKTPNEATGIVKGTARG